MPLGSLELREHLVVMAPMGPLERGASLDLRVPMGFLDPKDPRALLGRTGCQDTQAREEKWVSKGRPAPLVLQEWWDLREQQEKLALWGREATQAPQGPLESRDYLGQLEKKEQRVTLVPLGPQGRMVLLV